LIFLYVKHLMMCRCRPHGACRIDRHGRGSWTSTLTWRTSQSMSKASGRGALRTGQLTTKAAATSPHSSGHLYEMSFICSNTQFCLIFNHLAVFLVGGGTPRCASVGVWGMGCVPHGPSEIRCRLQPECPCLDLL
jgi:hypothetical protein